MTSRMTTSGLRSVASEKPSSPLAAQTTLKPSEARPSQSATDIALSSSTTRTLRPTPMPCTDVILAPPC